jgi:hypothetical protein
MMESGFQFALTNVYGPTNNSLKIQFLREIREVHQRFNLPWRLVADFNMIRSPDDTTSTNINLGLILEFNHHITDLQLTEIPLIGRKYTYSNGRPSPTLSNWTEFSGLHTGQLVH